MGAEVEAQWLASASSKPDLLRVASRTRKLKTSKPLQEQRQDGGNESSMQLPLKVLGLCLVLISAKHFFVE
eukprot:6908703-Karenia_brevis.AAC.1